MENTSKSSSPPKRSPSRDYRSIEAKFMMASLHKGAATLTRKKMLTTFRAFAAHAKLQRYGDVDPTTVTKKQLSKYVSTRIEAALARGQSFITVRYGTKGGRVRDTVIPAPYRTRALEAVQAALEVMAT